MRIITTRFLNTIALLILLVVILHAGFNAHAQPADSREAKTLKDGQVLTDLSSSSKSDIIFVCKAGNNFYYGGAKYECRFSSLDGDQSNIRQLNLSVAGAPKNLSFFTSSSLTVVPQALPLYADLYDAFIEKHNLNSESLTQISETQSGQDTYTTTDYEFVVSMFFYIASLIAIMVMLRFNYRRFDNFFHIKVLILSLLVFLLIYAQKTDLLSYTAGLFLKLPEFYFYSILFVIILLVILIFIYTLLNVNIKDNQTTHKKLCTLFFIELFLIVPFTIINFSISGLVLLYFLFIFTSLLIIRFRVIIPAKTAILFLAYTFVLIIFFMLYGDKKRIIIRNIELFDGVEVVQLPIKLSYNYKSRFFSTDYQSSEPIFINRYAIYHPTLHNIINDKYLANFNDNYALTVVNNSPEKVFTTLIKDKKLRSYIFKAKVLGNAFYLNGVSADFKFNCTFPQSNIEVKIYNGDGLIQNLDLDTSTCIKDSQLTYRFEQEEKNPADVIIYMKADSYTPVLIEPDEGNVQSYSYYEKQRVMFEKKGATKFYIVNFEDTPYTLHQSELNIAGAINTMLDKGILNKKGVLQIWSPKAWHIIKNIM